MKNLVQLIEVFENSKMNNCEIFNFYEERKEIQLLYNSISKSKSITDTELSQLIFKNETSHVQIKKLKADLSKKLENSLFFINTDLKFKNKRKENELKVDLAYTKCNILLKLLAKEAYFTLAEKTIKKSIKFSLTKYTVLISQQLMLEYGVFTFNKRKYRHYYSIFTKYKSILNDEMAAEEIYIRYCQWDTRPMSNNELINNLKIDIQKLSLYYERSDSDRITFINYIIQVYYSFKIQEYHKCIEICDSALKKISLRPYKDWFGLFAFSAAKVPSAINLGNFKIANNIIEYCYSFTFKETINFEKLLSYQFIITILTRNYLKSFSIIKKAQKVKFIQTRPHLKEDWKIKEVYIKFLISLKKIEVHEKGENQRFRINKFLNEVPIYSKSKKGRNITILIAQLLFFLIQERYNEYIDRIDSLKQYSQRYLSKNQHFRSNCFIQLLIKLPKATFNPIRVQRHCNGIISKLKTTKFELKAETRSTEIIPYETLWEYVLEILEKNLKK